MVSRVENFVLYGIEALLGASSFILGALYLSRVLDIYLTQGLGFNISAIINALLSDQISFAPIPLYFSALIGIIVGCALIYLCYILMRDAVKGLMELEKTQIAIFKSSQAFFRRNLRFIYFN